MFGTLVYGLCSITALLCAVLLLRAYGRSRYRLLFWSGICFAGLTVNNFLLMVDKVVLPENDLSVVRSAAALFAMIVLMYGLIFDEG
jgi:hydrogenase/urease accessory protein HupE